MENWINSLSSADREKIFAVMCSIREESDLLLEKGKPSKGSVIDVGGRVWESFMKGEMLAVFLRGLNKGMNPQLASDLAKSEAKDMIQRWNSKREYQVHRNESMMDQKIDFLRIRIEKAIQPSGR